MRGKKLTFAEAGEHEAIHLNQSRFLISERQPCNRLVHISYTLLSGVRAWMLVL